MRPLPLPLLLLCCTITLAMANNHRLVARMNCSAWHSEWYKMEALNLPSYSTSRKTPRSATSRSWNRNWGWILISWSSWWCWSSNTWRKRPRWATSRWVNWYSGRIPITSNSMTKMNQTETYRKLRDSSSAHPKHHSPATCGDQNCKHAPTRAQETINMSFSSPMIVT